MGYGVEEGEYFEALLEERLNREPGVAARRTLEILNFGASNYKPLQQLMVVEKALSFAPNAVVYVATVGEEAAAARYLVQVVKRQIRIPFPFLERVVADAGLEPGMSETEMLRRLAPFQSNLLGATYAHIVAAAKDRGAVPIWTQIPLPAETRERSRQTWEQEVRLAEQAGFAILSLDGAYEGQDFDSLRLAAWDHHPNAAGHARIAEQFYRALQENWSRLFAGAGAASKGSAPAAPR
jgi:hypothetical protein